jgi:hypothetical protein
MSPLPVFPSGPLWTERAVTKAFFYIPHRFQNSQGLLLKQNLTYLSKSSVMQHRFDGTPTRGPYGKRSSVFRANGLNIHSYLSESPFKQLSNEIGGKHMVTVLEAPRRPKATYKRVKPSSPRGSLTTLYYYPSAM